MPAEERAKAASQIESEHTRTNPPSARRSAADVNALFENIDPRALLPLYSEESPAVSEKAADVVSVARHPPKEETKPPEAIRPAQAPPSLPPALKQTRPPDPVFWASIVGAAVALIVLVVVLALIFGGKSREATEPKSSDTTVAVATVADKSRRMGDERGAPKEHREEPQQPPARPANAALSAEELFKKVSLAVVWIEVGDHDHPWGSGSGFLISEDGVIATNYHVIQGASVARVTFGDGSKHTIEGVVATDSEADLALLKIAGRFPCLELAGSDLPTVGSKVYAIGSPRGLINSLSEGLVSGHRPFDRTGIMMIQTTAAISPGSSGGPLFSADGKVVGVTAGRFMGGEQQSLNRAVPVERLLSLLATRGPLKELARASSQPLYGQATQRALGDVWAAIRNGDHAEALRLLGALPAPKKESGDYWFAVGFAQAALGNHQAAVDAHRIAVKLDPTNAYAFCNLGLSLGNLGRLEEATVALRSAVGLKPDFVDAHFYLGCTFNGLRRYQEAIASFKTVIALRPDRPGDYTQLGFAYLRARRYGEAVDSFRTAVDLAPDFTENRFWLAVGLHARQSYREALELLNAVLKLDPKHAGAHVEIGRCYQSLRQYQKALTAMEKAISLNPDSAYAHFWLGSLHLELANAALRANQSSKALKERDKALTHLRRAVKLDPNGEYGQRARDLLNS